MGLLSSSGDLAVWRLACAAPRCGNRCFRSGQRKAIIRTLHRLEMGSDYMGLVPLTGVEPVRYHYLGILSPVCLPISPQRLIQVSNKILYITTVIKSRNARAQPFSRHKKGDGINPSPLFYFSIVRSDRYQNYSYSLASLVRCSYLSSAILAARSNSLSALSGKERFSEL